MSFLENSLVVNIAEQIAQRLGYGNNQINFLTRIVNEFNCSPRRKFMDVAWRYYRNENDINDAIRYVIGRDKDNNAIKKESKVLANNRLSHNFMKKLTRQKIGYMLGKPFMLETVQAEDTLCEEFINACKEYIDEQFIKRIKNVARDSIVCGIGWMQVYYDEEGDLRFRRCSPEEIIPFWKDSDHTELDAVIRIYAVEYYTATEKKITNYLEYYLPEGTYYYVQDKAGNYVPNPEYNGPQPHFKIKPNVAGLEEKDVLWSKIPFIPFKYDADEQSLLVRVKSLIDDYDRKTSDIANEIDDFPNSMLVIKNYDGESREQFIATLNDYRAVFVQGDGDAKSLTTPMDIEGASKHLDRLRQDIYEFGQGVNTADKDIRDTSGVALRFIYADLDMDCIDWGEEVTWSLKQLLWFIQQDILMKKQIDYSKCEYDVIFNKDIIVNESETITNCLNSSTFLSPLTNLANHPWTKNAKKELVEVHQEKEWQSNLEHKFDKEEGMDRKAATYGTSSYK